MEAWEALARGEDNPLVAAARRRSRASTALLDPAEVRALLDPGKHVGDAPQRARAAGRSHRRTATVSRQTEAFSLDT